MITKSWLRAKIGKQLIQEQTNIKPGFVFLKWLLFIRFFYTDVRRVPHAVEACWSHNSEVRGSKPRSAITVFLLLFFVPSSCVKGDYWTEDKIDEVSLAEKQLSRLNLYWFETLTTWIRRYSFLFWMLVMGAFLKNPVQISGP